MTTGPKVREATAADRAGIQRLLRELHGDGADSTTLPEIRQQARTRGGRHRL
jgi:hypothetical protein